MRKQEPKGNTKQNREQLHNMFWDREEGPLISSMVRCLQCFGGLACLLKKLQKDQFVSK